MKKKSLLSELSASRNYTDDQNKNLIKKLVEDCINTIKNINKTGVTQYILEIPPFIVGFPVYSIQDIQPKVIKDLKKTGLEVIGVSTNSIYISW